MVSIIRYGNIFLSLFYFKASFILKIYSFFLTLFCDCAGQSSTNQYPLFPPPCKPSYKVVFFLFLFSNFILLFFLLFSSTNHQSISPLFPPISSYKIIFSSCKQTFLWWVNHTNLNKISFSNFYFVSQHGAPKVLWIFKNIYACGCLIVSVDQTAINLKVLFSLQKRKLSESFNQLSSSLPTKLYKIVRVKLPKTYLYIKKKLYFYQPFCDLIVYKPILITKRSLISPSSILFSHFMVNGLLFVYFAFHLCFYDSLCLQSNKCEFWWCLDKRNRYNALWLLDWTKGGGGLSQVVLRTPKIIHPSC